MKEALAKLTRYRELKALYDKHERALLPSMLVLGLVVDFITFQSIQIDTAFIILGIYLVVVGATIAFIQLVDTRRIADTFFIVRYLRLAAPLVIQFSFGALLSASFIFYWFSGAISVSWPFLLLLTLLMASNDILREYYQKPIVQICVYYFILFSIGALFLPFVVNAIDWWVFAVSGVLAALIIAIYTEVLARHIAKIKREKFTIGFVVAAIFILMNLLYIANVIPPIPLSIREAGVYHGVQVTPAGYLLLDEKESVLDKISPGEHIHIKPGGRVYVFTSIFAPVDLQIRIVHHWQKYHEGDRKWISRDTLSFNVRGGRDEGYRGFSFKSGLEPGIWRIDVETERGQVLGRMYVRVEHTETEPEYIEIRR